MIRPFRLRDIALVARLQKQAIRCDMSQAIVGGRATLWLAISSALMPSVQKVRTFVADGSDNQQVGQGLAQLDVRDERPEWDFGLLAASSQSGVEAVRVWTVLLQEVLRAAGQEGVVRLFAQVDKESPVIEAFSATGFDAFAQALTWRLKACPDGQHGRENIRAYQPRDEMGLFGLYRRITPERVQTAEGQFTSATRHLRLGHADQEFILSVDGEVRGYLGLMRGPKGVLLRIAGDPNDKEGREALLDQGLQHVSSHYTGHPIYVQSREYEGGWSGLLAKYKAEVVSKQTLLVKHLAIRIREAVPNLDRAYERAIEIAPTQTCKEYEPSPS